MLLLTLILPAIVQSHNQNHEGVLINRLNTFFGFDHNIFLLEYSGVNYPDFPYKGNNSANFTPQTVYAFDKENNLNITNTQITKMTLVSGCTFLIVVMNPTPFQNNTPLLARVKAIRKLHVNVKIGVFFTGNITSMVNIEELFRWSWNVGIANIFCAFYTSIGNDSSPLFNIYRFDPFSSNMINLTASKSLQNYFHDKAPNYRGYPLRMVLLSLTDIDIDVDMFDFKFWLEIKKAFNASMSDIMFTMKDARTRRLGESEYDFFMYQSHHSRKARARIPIYPHRMDAIVLLVPHAKQRSGIIGYMQNSTWKLIFVLTLIAVAAASLFLTISGYLKTTKIFVLKSVVDVVNLLMNDNAAIIYGRLHRADAFVIIPFTFVGLIVMNGILSAFQSYLTLPLYERQINSIGDLYESTVPILEDDSFFWTDRTAEILEDVSRHGGWGDKIHRGDWQEEADKFNSSVEFFLYRSQAYVYIEAQKQLSLKAYHWVTGVSFDIFYTTYQISDYFPFVERINEIVHRLQSAGLIETWCKTKSDEHIGYLKIINRQLEAADNATDNSELNVLWFGWVGSAIVFVCEIIWYKLKVRIKNLSNKLCSWSTKK